MSIEVELPDGTIVEFPDGASSGFISTILKRNSVEGKPLFRSIGGVQARQQEIRAVDSNKPSMDSFLNFMSGGFKPDIQGGDRLSNIGQYAAEDLSQLAEFGLGGVANFANNANQNQDNSVMDTVLAGAELIPSGALAGQTARLAGKGASRLFSEALDQSLRSPMTNQAGMIGFHGSPHQFDRFDHSRMGSGEGAQAYGWGTYIAENPDVAKGYASQLSEKTPVFVNKKGEVVESLVDSVQKNGVYGEVKYTSLESGLIARGSASRAANGQSIPAKDLDDVINNIRNIRLFESDGQTEAVREKALNILEEHKKNNLMLIEKDMSNLYEVDLPDEKIAQMLDWDKPLSEQPESVQRFIDDPQIKGRLLNSVFPKGDIDKFNKLKGSDIYQHIAKQLGEKDKLGRSVTPDQAYTSGRMGRAGIPGIKYLDGNSRADGTGTSNFVVFDENDMSILSRNGENLGNKGLLGDNTGMKLSQTEKQDWLDQVQAQHPTQYDSGVKKARRKGKHKTVDGLYQYVKNNMLGMQKANTPIKKTKVWAPMESDFDLDEMGFKQTYSSNSRNDNGFDSGATSSFSNYWTHPSGATVRYSDHAPVNARAAGHDVLIHPNSHASNEEALKSIEDAISKRMNK
jgi:hypothetical protein